MGLHLLSFWPFLGFHFLSFWPFWLSFPFWSFGPSFPFILVFWAFISFHFGLLGLHFLNFWLVWAATWGPPHKLPKTARFLMKFTQILSARPAAFCNFWPFGPSFPFIFALWAFISFHFCLLGLDFLSFWPFGPSFPFILAFWAFISFHFGLLGLHFLNFWLVWAATWGPPHKLPKTARFLMKFTQILSAPRPAAFCNFWPFGPSFPFIFALWAFISFHFGLLGLHFFHFGLLGLHFFSFWPFGLSFPSFLACLGCHVGSPRGWVRPSVTRNSLLMAPTKEDAAWAASRYVLGHGAGFTLR